MKAKTNKQVLHKKSCIFFKNEEYCKALKECNCNNCKFYKNFRDIREIRKQEEFNRGLRRNG